MVEQLQDNSKSIDEICAPTRAFRAEWERQDKLAQRRMMRSLVLIILLAGLGFLALAAIRIVTRGQG